MARDTWRGLAALTDRENGLPVDHVRFLGGADPAQRRDRRLHHAPARSASTSRRRVAAHELGLVTREEAVTRLRRELDTLERLETWRGFFFNFYDTTSLERTSHFVSFVDSAWLTAGLMVVRQAFPELAPVATRADRAARLRLLLRRGASSRCRTATSWTRAAARRYHYATLYTEARLGSLIAIGKGDVPEAHWFRMLRTFPPDCDWQSQPPKQRNAKTVRGHATDGGWYEWKELRYVPSWGGSMFEALMPTLFLDERRFAPRSLGRNDEVHVEVQRRFAIEELGWPGLGPVARASRPGPTATASTACPCSAPRGYHDAAVTPHAVALALAVRARGGDATRCASSPTRYDVYGEFGFYDSVDPQTGEVATAYLSLDQAHALPRAREPPAGRLVQKRFAADPIAQRALPILADEDFFD